LWTPDVTCRYYHLEKSYFHLYAIPNKDERDELICLHADPEEPTNTPQGRVKASIHVHVKSKEPRLQSVAKSHLPFCYLTVDEVLRSLASFDEALLQAVAVMRQEVLDRYA
jgi:hypothetical protein